MNRVIRQNPHNRVFMYIPKTHATLAGEKMDVLEVIGKIASAYAEADDGKTIGFSDTMSVLGEILAVESEDYERKRAAAFQIQQPLFAR